MGAPLRRWHLSKDLKEGGERMSDGNNGVKTFQAERIRVQRLLSMFKDKSRVGGAEQAKGGKVKGLEGK